MVWVSLLIATALVVATSSHGQLARLGTSSRPVPGFGAVPGAYPPSFRLLVALVGAGAVLLSVPGRLGLVAGALALPGAFVSLGRLEQPKHKRRRESLETQLPLVAELLAVSLSSGTPLRAAVSAVAEVVPQESSELLRRVSAFVRAGGSDADAWRQVNATTWVEPARDIVRSIESGSALAETLRLHAVEARRAERARREAAAKRIGVKIALPLMCCFLPAFLAVGVVPIIFSLALNFFG